jgi:hypothetical protein
MEVWTMAKRIENENTVEYDRYSTELSQYDRHVSKALNPFFKALKNLIECRLAAVVESARFGVSLSVGFPRSGIA